MRQVAFAAGYVYGVVGQPQKQSALLATVMAGTKGSAMGFLVGRDIQMPRVERLFFDPVVSVGYFKDTESYINGNPDFSDENAGSNDSDKDNFVKGVCCPWVMAKTRSSALIKLNGDF
jgi:hypothetical protein